MSPATENLQVVQTRPWLVVPKSEGFLYPPSDQRTEAGSYATPAVQELRDAR